MNKFRKCLYCGQKADDSGSDFHAGCSRKFFGTSAAPILPYAQDDIHLLARQIVERSIAVTGVQPKLSLSFEKKIGDTPSRLTIVGLWGDYILKPPHLHYSELVEIEYLTMWLAKIFGIETVPFSLIRLQSGELAYITKRIDRWKGNKRPMEDMCQLSEKLTEYKYRGSVEQVAKIIRHHTSNPGLDVVRFVELVVFCFLTGNADMHLKNYSLLTLAEDDIRLAPAYDLVATQLILPEDQEESALTINGKKNKLTLSDFEKFSISAGVPDQVFQKMMKKMRLKISSAITAIEDAELSVGKKLSYLALFKGRASRLGLFDH
jgi:serine/threonine-protein kinase HipA